MRRMEGSSGEAMDGAVYIVESSGSSEVAVDSEWVGGSSKVEG